MDPGPWNLKRGGRAAAWYPVVFATAARNSELGAGSCGQSQRSGRPRPPCNPRQAQGPSHNHGSTRVQTIRLTTLVLVVLMI